MADDTGMRITEFSRIVDRSVETLREWDRTKKLVPDRSECGQRIYRERHVQAGLAIVQGSQKK
jgi:DNA-binding transcriptional MerR regulator